MPVCNPTQHSDSASFDLIAPSVRQWILLVSVGTMKAMSAKTLISCSKQSLKLICRHNNFFCAKFHEGNHLSYENGCENNESVVSSVPGAGQHLATSAPWLVCCQQKQGPNISHLHDSGHNMRLQKYDSRHRRRQTILWFLDLHSSSVVSLYF